MAQNRNISIFAFTCYKTEVHLWSTHLGSILFPLFIKYISNNKYIIYLFLKCYTITIWMDHGNTKSYNFQLSLVLFFLDLHLVLLLVYQIHQSSFYSWSLYSNPRDLSLQKLRKRNWNMCLWNDFLECFYRRLLTSMWREWKTLLPIVDKLALTTWPPSSSMTLIIWWSVKLLLRLLISTIWIMSLPKSFISIRGHVTSLTMLLAWLWTCEEWVCNCKACFLFSKFFTLSFNSFMYVIT